MRILHEVGSGSEAYTYPQTSGDYGDDGVRVVLRLPDPCGEDPDEWCELHGEPEDLLELLGPVVDELRAKAKKG